MSLIDILFKRRFDAIDAQLADIANAVGQCVDLLLDVDDTTDDILNILEGDDPPEPPAEVPLWDERLTTLGITYQRRTGAYRLAAAWLTINGQWDDVPDWAKKWQLDVLGGDHNCYGRLETPDGKAIFEDKRFILAWPDGGDERTAEPSGWANIPMAGQNWDPAKGPGPYDWFVESGDKLLGVGMPWNHHYSFFCVWHPRQTELQRGTKLQSMKAAAVEAPFVLLVGQNVEVN
jgi:hypothetical protein